ERLVITKTGQYIEKEDLPREILDPASWAEGEEIAEQLPYKQAKAVFEKRYFKALLKAHDYNVTSSALFAGLSRRHLQEKLREFKIRVSDQKNDEDED
ncbi:MAG: hypothetical protein KC940_22405, partial [Candidatus Omnitrophica bacterium]|nr:hypothetical protein [Candidatus Omnitrophota bacterium]